MKRILLALTLAACSWLPVAQAEVQVEDAWVREAPPGARMLAAYLTVNNSGAEDLVLVEVQSPAFSHIMLHKSEVVDGVARMVHLDEIVIPAQGSVQLQPGGMHLMMPAPEARPSAGDRVPLVLIFADGNRLEVQADVRKKP
ncbi:MAG: copper chaperone PCu(A)C [Gammaproteobacteria bacterium]|nr:MAG: copper chaperone PCu(A)C [Gammaproteobacteria bacterium]